VELLKSPLVYRKIIRSNVGILGEVVKEMLECITNVCTCVDECIQFELKVILNEILINAIKHGNTYDESKNIEIEMSLSCNDVLSICVKDEGCGYNYKKACNCHKPYNEADDISNIDEGGRGILILKGLCDNVEVSRKGNKIKVSKSIIKK
jgi:serine/threonine-protein kinase RsbW